MPKLSIPSGWNKRVQSGILQAISLGDTVSSVGVSRHQGHQETEAGFFRCHEAIVPRRLFNDKIIKHDKFP